MMECALVAGGKFLVSHILAKNAPGISCKNIMIKFKSKIIYEHNQKVKIKNLLGLCLLHIIKKVYLA